jgi:ADP-heptose:LPS heptosyltransferase
MLRPLQLSDSWERGLVRLADVAIAPLGWPGWLKGPPRRPVRRVLLLRLERIGDLVMTLDGIAYLRAELPTAEIDLVVGSWNASLASLIPGVNRVETLDLPWLTREGPRTTWRQLMSSALRWRRQRYDLVVNFEPDIRSNFLAWLSRGRRRVGYWTAGGGAFLTAAIAYQPWRHVATNAVRLAGLANASTPLEEPPARSARLEPTAAARRDAARLTSSHAAPLIGVHPSAGRAIKQWPPERFRAVARQFVVEQGATIVLTGASGDEDLIRQVQEGLPAERVLDVCGRLDVVGLAALFERLDVLITGDTGPMHLAAAVSVPTVCIFGPSDPARYGPSGPDHRVVRIDLPCSPCNRIRQPPARCVGHTPDCLSGLSIELVAAAVNDVLHAGSRSPDAGRATALRMMPTST